MGSFTTSLPILWLPGTGADWSVVYLFSWLFLQRTIHLSWAAFGVSPKKAPGWRVTVSGLQLAGGEPHGSPRLWKHVLLPGLGTKCCDPGAAPHSHPPFPLASSAPSQPFPSPPILQTGGTCSRGAQIKSSRRRLKAALSFRVKRPTHHSFLRGGLGITWSQQRPLKTFSNLSSSVI